MAKIHAKVSIYTYIIYGFEKKVLSNWKILQKLGDSGGPLWVEENGKGMIWYYICYLSEFDVSLFEVK